jgi:hypothetical protein
MSIEPYGYIVVDKDAKRVQGFGPTQDEAWSDTRTRFASAGVPEIDEEAIEESEDDDCHHHDDTKFLVWRKSEMQVFEATKNLLKDIDGNTEWKVINLDGSAIACTEDEFDAYQDALVNAP